MVERTHQAQGASSRAAARPEASFALLRTPLLPIDVLERLEACLEPGDEPAGSTRARIGRELVALLDDPIVARAVALASPGLLEATLHGARAGVLADKTLVPLYALVRRMCGRATPFGLAAGVSLLAIGDRTRLELGAMSDHVAHGRIDLDYLRALEARLVSDPTTRSRLRYTANESATFGSGRVVYVADRSEGDTWRAEIVTLEATPALLAALEAAGGGVLLDELAQRLAGRGERHDVLEFVEELVNERVLVPTARARVISCDPAEDMARELAVAGLDELAAALREAAHAQRRTTLSVSSSEASLAALPRVAGERRRLHVDLEKHLEHGVLSKRVVATVMAAVRALGRIRPPPARGPLAKFREAFLARYEDASVPLLDAIDLHRGVGFVDDGLPTTPASGPLLAGLPLVARAPGDASFRRRDGGLLRLLHRAWSTGAVEIEPTAQELNQLASSSVDPIASSLAAHFALVGADDESHRVVLFSATGPTSLRTLSRFAYMNDELQRHVDDEATFEARALAPAVVAELVYAPEGKFGNIATRSTEREAEIWLLGAGSLGAERLRLDDLWLRLDARGELRLWSARLAREVVPRATTAHNEGRAASLPYRFLTALQREGQATSLAWSWGNFTDAPFLPRVALGGAVVSLAQWTLDREHAKALGSASASDATRLLGELRDTRRCPRRVGLVTGEDALPIDLADPLSVELVQREARRAGSVRLQELMPFGDELPVRGPEGRYVSEIVLPLRLSPPERAPMPDVTTNVQRAERVKAPGSEWLYAKVYADPSYADEIVARVARPFARALGDRRWFFVRYHDPAPHLRLRFCVGKARWGAAASELLDRIASLSSRASIQRVQLDTYEREIERYGGSRAMDAIEAVFSADSELAVTVAKLAAQHGEEARWRLSYRSFADVLARLIPDPERRLKLARGMRAAYAREHGFSDVHESRLATRTRALKPELMSLLDHPIPFPGFERALMRRRRSLTRAYVLLERLACDGALSRPSEEIASSIAHMAANRLFPTDQRAQELVLYDYYARALDSTLALERRGLHAAKGGRCA